MLIFAYPIKIKNSFPIQKLGNGIVENLTNFLTVCTVLWQLYIENQKHIPNFWIYDAALLDKQLLI